MTCLPPVPVGPTSVFVNSTVTLPNGKVYPLYGDVNNRIVAPRPDNGWYRMLVIMLRGATLSLTTDGGTRINMAAPPHPDGTPDKIELLRIFNMVSPLLCSGCFSATLSFPPTQEELEKELEKIISDM